MSEDRQDAQPDRGGLSTGTVPPPVANAAGEHEPWLEEDLAPLPPRPRRKLLAPAPLALLAVLLIACGFIGGVLVEKGQNGSTGAAPSGASGFAARLRGLTASRSAAGSGASPFAGAGGAGATVGTVAFSSGRTLYVTSGEGNTVKVKTSAATTVTKTVKTAVKKIHPGESVTITGTAGSDGTVSAAAIRVGTSALGLGALPGGASGSAGGTTGSSRSSEGPALFGAG